MKMLKEKCMGMKLLGLRVMYFRKAKGLTQKQLAEKCKMSSDYIQKIESGKYDYSLDLLYEISKELDISISKFFEFDE